MQSRYRSLYEVSINVGIEYLVSFTSLFLILPILEVESTVGDNALITLYFTLLSIGRGDLVRRYFNNK